MAVSGAEASRQAWPGLLAVAGLLAAVGVLVYLVGRPLATDDLWWHLALGEVYADQGPWVEEDPLLHTSRDRPPIPHEWLFQVALHGALAQFGFHGLRILHVLAVLGILAWCFRIFRRALPDPAWAALATTALVVLSWYRLFQLRPELASLVAMLGLYVLLIERGTKPSWQAVTGSTLLLLLWANVHSLFAIGPALLVAALLGVGLRRLLANWLLNPDQRPTGDSALARRWLTALALGLLATLVNPRGFEQHTTFWLESASGNIWQIRDDFLPWNPLQAGPDVPALTFLSWWVAEALLLGWLITVGSAFVRLLRQRSKQALDELDTVHLGLSAAAFVAMAVAVRFHWMAIFPLLHLLRAAQRVRVNRPTVWPAASLAAAMLTLVLGFALPGAVQLDAFIREVAIEREGYFANPWLDVRYGGPGVRFLEDTQLRGRLFHPFNVGGFLGYWLAPELRTFIDGRLDHVPSEVLRDYLKIRRTAQKGTPQQLKNLLDEREIDIFFGMSFPETHYAEGHWITHLRRLGAWKLVFASEYHSVYLRKNSRNTRNFQRVSRYYRQQAMKFSATAGFDVDHAIRRRPGWAARQGLLPKNYQALVVRSTDPDPSVRSAALERLGRLYWQISAFDAGVKTERRLLELHPQEKASRWRLADALLQLGQPVEAHALASSLLLEDPSYKDIRILERIARRRASRVTESDDGE